MWRGKRTLLLENDIIIFQHPFYWYSSPAMLKEWQDLVLEFGFAYGPGGTALQGKMMMNVISTGASKAGIQEGRAQHLHYKGIPEALSNRRQTSAI